ncbi:MAG: hypothetical protein HY718_01985 [Planctomycetes bacterium]|nr:hypothetical protein [Planctomycetota bacterium]
MRGEDTALQCTGVEAARSETPRRTSLLLVGFLAVSILAGWLSDGVYHEDDLTHYQIARWSRHDVRYLLDPWGRPGFTVPYSLVAWVGSSQDGLRACRVFSALIAAATAWLTYCIARSLGLRHAWAAVPLLYLQPLFARLSLTTLTETPLAFYLALATWLLLTGRNVASAALMALAPVTRDESVVLLPIWAWAIWRQGGRWWTYPLLCWALVAHNLAAGWWLGVWPASRWLDPAGSSVYGQGTPLTFIPKVMQAAGPAIVALAILGSRRLRRAGLGWVIVLAPLAWFLVQTAVYLRGAYSSGGYSRFLVPICPWLAVLATAGVRPLLSRRPIAQQALGATIVCLIVLWAVAEIEWHWRVPLSPADLRTWALVGRVSALVAAGPLALCAAWLLRARRRACPVIVAGSAGTAVIGLLVAGLAGFRPLKLAPDQASVQGLASVISRAADEDRLLVSSTGWVYHWLDRWTGWRGSTDVRGLLDEAEPGTLFVWDARFCTEMTPRLTFTEIHDHRGWRQLWPVGDLTEGTPRLALFECQPLAQASSQPSTPAEEH